MAAGVLGVAGLAGAMFAANGLGTMLCTDGCAWRVMASRALDALSAGDRWGATRVGLNGFTTALVAAFAAAVRSSRRSLCSARGTTHNLGFACGTDVAVGGWAAGVAFPSTGVVSSPSAAASTSLPVSVGLALRSSASGPDALRDGLVVFVVFV